jgi:hypothetical protein
MNTYGVEVQLHAFLTSVLYGRDWSASLPGGFITRERAADIRFIGGWVGLRTGLDVMANEKSSCPYRESNPCRPARSLVTMLTEISRLLIRLQVVSVVQVSRTEFCVKFQFPPCILHTRMYLKVSGLAAWSKNCNCYSCLPLGAVVSIFCESV